MNPFASMSSNAAILKYLFSHKYQSKQPIGNKIISDQTNKIFRDMKLVDRNQSRNTWIMWVIHGVEVFFVQKR